MEKVDKVVEELVAWLRKQVEDAQAEGLVFGLSGGIDSALVAALAKKAFPDSSLGIIMPCYSDPIDEEHGRLVSDSLDLQVKKVDLSDTFDLLLGAIKEENRNRLAISNLKPRLRMTTLYYFAQNNKYLVVGPSNKSEFTVGYFTKHGDSGVDILPLASFVKSEIVELARYLKLPEVIIEKAPTAGLWTNQTDEEELGFSYDTLDRFIKTGDGPRDIVGKIEKMNENSKHKRSFPPIFRG
ncbi:MAG: NAD(+) synthase [Tissierellaceae bacterium]